MESIDISPGTVIGEYRIVSKIGKGGMGIVYKAYQESLERYVAVKVLKTNLSQMSNYLQQFQYEARSAAQLRHPNIVQIYGIGEHHDIHYFIMELVPGKTLKEIIQEKHQSPVKSGRLIPVYDALEMILQVAGGLHFAHESGFLHRDIKPANIIKDDKTQRMMIADFGLSRPVMTKKESLLGSMTGTPPFMAPEIFLGKPWTKSTDIYALGATLFNMLTARPLHESNNLKSLIHKIVNEKPPPAHGFNRDVPEEISAVIRKCTEKKPSDRYGTVDDFIKDIRLFLNEGRTHAFEFYSLKEPALKTSSEKEEENIYDPSKEKIKRRKITSLIIGASFMVAFIISSLLYQDYRNIAHGRAYCRKKLQDAKNLSRMGRTDMALSFLQDICNKFPDTPYAEDARRMMAELKAPKKEKETEGTNEPAVDSQ
ncbi:MAG: protein kinase [Candidatus Aureabacteria bacterium]|nr:protein kinase [Candidatus Auribacterota bacterium]